MAASSKALTALFSDLRGGGFQKKGLVWCKRTAETVFSFELQRSAHLDRYFVNVGVWVLSLGEASHLPPNRCHAYGRLGGSDVEAALDFGTGPIPERERVLGRFKVEVLLPLAEQCSTVKGAAEMLASGALRVPLVRPEAQALLLRGEAGRSGREE